MKQIDKINVAQICSIKSFINQVCDDYVYRHSKKFLWWKRKEGFYTNFVLGENKYCTKEQIESSGKYEVKNNTVYYKPHLVTKMSNGILYIEYFNTEKELYQFMDKPEIKSITWIQKL